MINNSSILYKFKLNINSQNTFSFNYFHKLYKYYIVKSSENLTSYIYKLLYNIELLYMFLYVKFYHSILSL